jgi:DNA polymerase-1
MQAILDADVITFMAASIEPKEIEGVWDEDDTKTVLEAKCDAATNIAQYWVEVAECTTAKLAFSCPSLDNFRRRVHPMYKHNRKTEKPEHYYEIEAYLKDKFPNETGVYVEGDDILGMHMSKSDDWVAVSTDKDIRTVPGKFIRIRHNGTIDRYDSTEAEANHFWMWQTLTGDTVDGYKGCPGCGVKGADACLPRSGARIDQLWHAVLQRYQEAWTKPTYRKKFITGHYVDEALMNARVARILRHVDECKGGPLADEPILWKP